MNHEVENPDGAVIGTIEDMIAGKDGRIDYVILGHGGLLGIGERLIPIPWKAVKSLPDEDTLLVNISIKSLEKAPNFEPKKWPDYTKPDWDTEIRQYYVVEGALKE
jgi:sporulation protein YlmC with PRC-barrel domain